MPQDTTIQSLRTTLGASAREARLRLALTQEDVADRLGITPEVYGRLERGLLAPSVFTLRRLCLTLRLPADLALGLPSTAPSRVSRPPPSKPRRPESSSLQRILRGGRRLTPHSLRLVARLTAALPKRSPAKPRRPRS
jgi:DNA-binding XRE family transcriptional regulator